MAEVLSDGTVSWLGGMDTSRSPAEIAEIQYAKATNVIIPDSQGGIRARYGLHCCRLVFESKQTESLYMENPVLAEGYYIQQNKFYLIALVKGYALRFTELSARSYRVENLNPTDQNADTTSTGWVIPIPGGCIINNGFDYPLLVINGVARRSDPRKGEIGIGQMGVYLQHRSFIVDQSGTQIIASDYFAPHKATLEGTGIIGFMCPDSDEKITAIARQKTIMGTVEGGNLIWSSNKDIYSADVRGTRSEWSSLSSRVGKTTETVPGFSAASSYSFEPFNTNIYFRNCQYGLSDIKQSEYQFVNLDAVGSQSIEAAYYLENDTDWMLDRCYTRSCNKRLFTTVAPQMTERGDVYWNGLLSFHPASIYPGQGTLPRRFESIFTGVRPWCLTSVKGEGRDKLFIHSHDQDGKTRLYFMDETTNYDIDSTGAIKEIQGFIETRAYTFKNPFLLKKMDKRFYRMNLMDRSVSVTLFSRPEVYGPWVEFFDQEHKVCRVRLENGVFIPEPHQGQTRPYVNLSEEKFSDCYTLGKSVIALQYRIEFSGPFNFDSIICAATLTGFDSSVSQPETECETLVYSYRPDYSYSIQPLI